MATRLWQNTAKVHFNVEARPDGNRLIYGGHIISMARALSFNGLANAAAHRRDQRRLAHRAGVRRRHRLRVVGGARQGAILDAPASVPCGCGWSRPRAATSR